MAERNAAHPKTVWPMPSFSFQVNWGALSKVPFQEVSGLDSETQVIEYRHGDSLASATIKQPGIQKIGNVTMKRGVFVKDQTFWSWYSQVTMNTIPRTAVVIQLLDETGKPTMTWTLNNAWPTKISAPTLQSDGNEVAIESIEVAYEGLTIANG